MGNKLKEFRRLRGIGQLELANAVGISRQYLSEIENQKKLPTVKIAFDCAKYLNVSVEDLFFYL
ncbi:TPA: helix-turn-helix transcriptional regulator [Streptococcus pyogenes]|uniref:helix-turn-helix transcriptional regulator n=1 Tax=Bacillota TaxID=1239 RepID=UPI0012B0A978|nr:helix-turn-helix transcriptional regulator [Finegoldia magna]MSB17457.1 helix-turn-helix domain-containing protein [Finegoldia magna]MSD46178.1 helix-turn-helix domain-containing protein [Finegoldia magna]